LGEAAPPPVFRTFLQHYGYTRHLIPWLKRHAADYDAIIVNGLWNFSAFAAAMALPGRKTPYFVFTHGMMDPWFKRTYPLKHLAKLVFWLLCEGRLLAGARKVFFTTEEERRLAHGQFPLWRYNEQVVGYGTAAAPPPTPEQRAAFQAKTPELGDRPYLLFLSRIHRKKGCDLLVDAFAKIAKEQPDLQLVVAGPDQENLVAALRERAEALGVGDRIHWPGMLKGDAKWGGYRGAEAFILPSHQENFGIVVAEALACGTPVLISDKVNIWREVEAAGAGLVRPDDAGGTEDLLRAWLALSDTDRAAMRVAAHQTFEKNFDVATIAPALLEIIKSSL
jgi:glycosyltransferase involved in cell wall biosynthesis